MLLRRNPSEAYRRVDFDARVNGAEPHQLVDMCLEQVIGSLGSAVFAQDRGDNCAKSAALTRAVTALTALLMGVDNNAEAGPALTQLYDSARRSVLDSAVVFNGRRLEMIRADFAEIRQALRQSMGN